VPAVGGWPIDTNDPNGSQLVRAIGEKLQLTPDVILNEDKFGRLRRTAREGRDALHVVLAADAADGSGFDDLVAKVYTWARAVKDYWGSTSAPSR
jgi:hypothetical protein